MSNDRKVGAEMGRKRLSKVKVRLNLSIDQDLLDELEKDGVNKSRLFSISAKVYLKKKARKKQKDN